MTWFMFEKLIRKVISINSFVSVKITFEYVTIEIVEIITILQWLLESISIQWKVTFGSFNLETILMLEF